MKDFDPRKIMPAMMGIVIGISATIMTLQFFTTEINSILRYFKQMPIIVYILAGSAVLIIAALFGIFWLLKSARKEAKVQPVTDEPPLTGPDRGPESAGREGVVAEEAAFTDSGASAPPPIEYSRATLKKSFSAAISFLRKNSSVKNFRYEIPWFLMVGPSGAGKTHLLKEGGVKLTAGAPPAGHAGEKAACDWHFCEKGVVLDAAGDMVLRKDGRTADRKLWKSFLSLMLRHRSKRPLDGILLAIPASDLMGEGGHPPDVNTSARKSERIYERLSELQRRTGMRLPVYVVVTRCDEITGFSSFCQALPDRVTGHMLGWSSPYAADTAFQPDWTNQAFERIERDLFERRLEVFAEPNSERRGDPDGVFRFVNNFRKMEAPMGVWLEKLFRQTAYHESFVLRGIYFTGNGGRSADASRPNSCFVRDLFEKKVFPESTLARPTNRRKAARTRRTLAFQALAVLFLCAACVGLWMDARELQRDTRAMVPVLDNIQRDIALNQTSDQGEGLMLYVLLKDVDQSVSFQKNVRHLVQGMGRIRDLQKPMIPSSWYSPVHQDIRQALTYAYGEIILKGMFIGLVQKAKDIFQDAETTRPDPDTDGRLLTVNQLPEFQSLENFMDRTWELGEYVDLFNRLGSTDNLSDLSRLSAYVFEEPLPPGFFRDAATYHNALGETEYREFDPRIFRLKARYSTIRKLVRRLYDRLFHNNLLVRDLEELAERIDGFGQGDLATNNRVASGIMADIEEMEQMLRDPAFSWVFFPQLNLGQDFTRILTQVEQSPFQGPEMRNRIEEMGEKEFQDLRRKLAGIRLNSAPILEVDEEDGGIQNELAGNLRRFKGELDNLLDENFMTVVTDTELEDAEDSPTAMRQVDYQADTRVRWDPNFLKQALALFEPYEMFKEGRLSRFPEENQEAVNEMARVRLERSVENLAARAQRFQEMNDAFGDGLHERDLKSEIENFRRTSGMLHYLITYAERLELNDLHQRLSDFVYWQTVTLLDRITAMEKEDSLWAMRADDFSWWDGIEPVNMGAFGVADDVEMVNYLDSQRKRIFVLAMDYAQPVVTFLEETPLLRHESEERTLNRWKRIISELEKYQNKKPENSLAQLEKFIRFDMNKVNPAEFAESLSEEEINARSGDIFLARRNQLRKKLWQRSSVIARTKTKSQFQVAGDYFDGEVAGFFNNRLAGRFPFAPLPEESGFSEADPDDIRAFFRLYEEGSPLLRESFDRMGDEVSTDERMSAVAGFLDRMDRVEEFFQVFLGGGIFDPAGAVHRRMRDYPVFDMDVRFRVNREFEIGANRIIGWRLRTDDRSVSFGQTDDTVMRWYYGDPVSLELRWAKDGPVHPVWAGESANIVVDDLTATWEYRNYWSLLVFILRHAAPPGELENMTDSDPHTLSFAVETANRGNAVEVEKARVRDDAIRLLAKLEWPEPVEAKEKQVVTTGSTQSSSSGSSVPSNRKDFIGGALWQESRNALYRFGGDSERQVSNDMADVEYVDDAAERVEPEIVSPEEEEAKDEEGLQVLDVKGRSFLIAQAEEDQETDEDMDWANEAETDGDTLLSDDEGVEEDLNTDAAAAEDMGADEDTEDEFAEEDGEDDWADEEDDWADEEDDWDDEGDDWADDEDDWDDEEEDEVSYEVPEGWRPGDPVEGEDDEDTEEDLDEDEDEEDVEEDAEESDQETDEDEDASDSEEEGEDSDMSQTLEEAAVPLALIGLTPKEQFQLLETVSQRRRKDSLAPAKPESIRKKLLDRFVSYDNLTALQQEKSMARAYIRLRIVSADKSRKTLLLPSFPYKAPLLTGDGGGTPE